MPKINIKRNVKTQARIDIDNFNKRTERYLDNSFEPDNKNFYIISKVYPQPLCTFCRYFWHNTTPDSWISPAEYNAGCSVDAPAFEYTDGDVEKCGKFYPKAKFQEHILRLERDNLISILNLYSKTIKDKEVKD